jgi:hypothetical protein
MALYYHMCNLIEYNLCLMVLLLILCVVARIFIIPHESPDLRGSVDQTANGDFMCVVRASGFYHLVLLRPRGLTILIPNFSSISVKG